jgi:hypothetical protein
MSSEDIIQDGDATALAVYHAFQDVFWDQVDVWEPDTLRLEADRKKLDIPEENFDAYHAFRTLRMHPSAFWEGNVFENTVMALNKYPVRPNATQVANPGQLSWAVEQMRLFEKDTLEFDYEPSSYAAVSCQFYGFCVCPEQLDFAQERLAQLTPECDELRSEVKKRWAELENPEEHPFDESPEGVQLAFLASVEVYLEQQRAALRDQLAALS